MSKILPLPYTSLRTGFGVLPPPTVDGEGSEEEARECEQNGRKNGLVVVHGFGHGGMRAERLC
ncbi:unnamed protein product [Prunus armeniaca]|uniref:Uncharacterized protein n=1 Tax=Prunus armeniaca TaxID=36596 RepID=A0A6J5VT64_PRUAR|nr:unnamed protein product [Prunus armeniaca]CAB4320886.1 unnamed protein product [Prunus armeniaca]